MWNMLLFVIRTSARPNPKPRFRYKSSLHRIPLDIPQNPPILIRTANPMIVRLALPERQPGASQQLVGPPRRHPFDPLHTYRRSPNRLDQQMNMVAHYSEPTNLTQSFLMLRRPQHVHHCVSHARFLQPHRTRGRNIELPVHIRKASPDVPSPARLQTGSAPNKR